MKKFTITLFVCLVSMGLTFAQAPGMFKYQTVVRNASGDIIPSQLVKFRISLLKGSPTGTVSFREEHTTATSQFGIVNLEIGNGSSQTGEIDTIQWGKADYFIEIELDPTGSSGFQQMGTSQILSVPYALYAEKSKTAIDDNDKSPTNELQTLSLSGNNLSISNGNSVNLPRIIAGRSSGGTTPSILSGSGFTISHGATGTYDITFTTPFAATPTVVAHSEFANNYPTGNSWEQDILIVNISSTGCRIFTGNCDECSFSFIAVGN